MCSVLKRHAVDLWSMLACTAAVSVGKGNDLQRCDLWHSCAKKTHLAASTSALSLSSWAC